jgi:hypothetical protein
MEVYHEYTGAQIITVVSLIFTKNFWYLGTRNHITSPRSSVPAHLFPIPKANTILSPKSREEFCLVFF